MIRLTPSGKISYQMLNQTVVSLVLYAGLMLLAAIQTLPTAPHLPIRQLTDHILHFILMGGMITSGMSLCTENKSMVSFQRWLYRLWWVLIIGTLLVGGLAVVFTQESSICVNLNSTRPITNMIVSLLSSLLLFMALAISTYCPKTSAYLRVWQIGMMLTIGSLLAQFVVTYQWKIVVQLFQVYVGYGVVSISILFWLMTRWSHVRPAWAQDGVYIVASLITISGILISFAPLGLPAWVGFLSAVVIPICYMIFAGHSYRALKDRTHNQSLSPHWVAIAVLFWLAGGGFLGMISTQGELPIWIQGTSLASVQIDWMLWGSVAIILGLVNYQATALRGENRRVTGYMPLWLIAFGKGLALIIQGCIGVVEVYLLKILNIHQPHIDHLLIPLHIIQIVCLIAVAIGIAIYALGFWVRYPDKIMTDHPSASAT